MTVEELIKKLNKYPKDSVVMIESFLDDSLSFFETINSIYIDHLSRCVCLKKEDH